MSRRAGRSARGLLPGRTGYNVAQVGNSNEPFILRREPERVRHQRGYQWRGRSYKTGSGLFRAIERHCELSGYSETMIIFAADEVRFIAIGKPTIRFERQIDANGRHIIGDDPK